MESLSLGEKIALLRTRKNLSKIALSKITGIHCVTLSKYERNLMKPSVAAIKKIVIALDTSADYLIFDNYKEKNVTSIKNLELLSLAEKVDTLQEKDLAFIKNTIANYLKNKSSI
jgi:transcriptional regulator with XRE-family HTH domain